MLGEIFADVSFESPLVTNEFARPLVEFWSRLEGTIHPEDVQAAKYAPEVLNFDYPPPAFVGDIFNARIFILMGNGGYDRSVTPSEFSADGSEDVYRARLSCPSAAGRGWTAPYYLDRPDIGDWLTSGTAAVVNALAYRSEETTPAVRRFADKMPSVHFHRRWLRGDLLSAAAAGRVRVVVHRPGLWQPAEEVSRSRNILVLSGTAPRQKLLSHEVRRWVSLPPDCA
ncbi:hypothetical protein AMST5_02894 [freshwater sediment metagenome]|uniref:Uncharacterized protein n=1 Tax=freshwater sediment metagenome TaxID=556182 RepID=A0AA48M107_9ZZZZ